MDPTITKALLLLVVGMVTVFVILLLVVLSGKILIRIINRYFPLPEWESRPATKPIRPFAPDTEMDHKRIAAIIAAVELVTGGKGKITGIKHIQ